MATLEQIRTVLAAQITRMTATTIGGADGLPTRWRGRPQQHTASHAVLFLGSPVTLGRDGVIQTYTASPPATLGQEYAITQEGSRIVTLEAQVHSYRAAGSFDAREYTRRIRDRMLLPSVCDALRTVGVSWGQVAMDRDLVEARDGHSPTVAQIDLRLNMAALEADTPTTWIEWMEFEATFTPGPIEVDGTAKVG